MGKQPLNGPSCRKCDKVVVGPQGQSRFLRGNQRPRRLARPRTPPFHGDNTGSNPVGDAKNPQ